MATPFWCIMIDVDEFEPRRSSIVDIANEIITMQETIDYQRLEIIRLRKIEAEYKTLLDESLRHGEAMMGNILKLCLTPVVVEACEENKNAMG